MSPIRLFALALSLLAAAPALAQPYPSKPIHILVGFAAGGPTEVAARLIGQKMTEKWGQQVLVEARPGAGGNIAGEAVAKAPPDGYTLLLPAFAHAVNPALYASMPFDTEKDFASVAMVATSANVFAVHPSLPVSNLKELIAYARANPGKITFGSAGNGTASHLSGELLNSMVGIRMTHVPYKGSAPATNDLIGGHISSAFVSVANALPLLKAGKIRPIGVASLRRVEALPDVPTLSEAGAKGYEVISWYGLLAPARTPQGIIAQLNEEVVRATNAPDGVERLATIGCEPSKMTPAEVTAYIRSELAKWSKVIQFAGVKATD